VERPFNEKARPKPSLEEDRLAATLTCTAFNLEEIKKAKPQKAKNPAKNEELSVFLFFFLPFPSSPSLRALPELKNAGQTLTIAWRRTALRARLMKTKARALGTPRGPQAQKAFER